MARLVGPAAVHEDDRVRRCLVISSLYCEVKVYEATNLIGDTILVRVYLNGIPTELCEAIHINEENAHDIRMYVTRQLRALPTDHISVAAEFANADSASPDKTLFCQITASVTVQNVS